MRIRMRRSESDFMNALSSLWAAKRVNRLRKRREKYRADKAKAIRLR